MGPRPADYEEPGGLQERPSYHMHLTLQLWVGAKRFSDVATHACLHLILKLHAKNVLQTFLGTLLRPQVYAIQVCYIVREVHSVRERDTERERERKTEVTSSLSR